MGCSLGLEPSGQMPNLASFDVTDTVSQMYTKKIPKKKSYEKIIKVTKRL